ncbi:MAG TPA: phage terminase large subunit [Gemmatimonadaceae bacterium]|nr:phage terminase large subunit [Gemmatimonadaceae bacterium]
MAGSAPFDFRRHPAFAPRTASAVVAEELRRAVQRYRPDPAAAPARATVRHEDGTPIGIGEYCRMVTPAWHWDWAHLRYIDAQLDRVIHREVQHLILQVPPRHGKSEKGTVRLPVYALELNPAERVIVAAYNSTLARKFSRKARRIARGRVELSDDRKAVEDWETGEGGGVRAVGVGEGVTGQGADLIIVDDPVKSRKEAESQAFRDHVWDWFTDDLYTRREPGCRMIVTMTRWHEDDLVGRILASESASDWTVIELPALAEEDDPLGRPVGAALCPDRYDEEALAKIRRVIGERSFSALYQQRPAPASGVIFKREWIRYYTTAEHPIVENGHAVPTLPVVWSSWLQSWDMSFKGNEDSDKVAGHVWSRLNADCYLRDRTNATRDFVATIDEVLRVTQKWPKALLKLVEDKANGPAVISTLRSKIAGLVAIEPEGDKVARAYAITPLFEAGNVWFPHPQIAPWITAVVLQLMAFPYGKEDDDVDALTQALRRFQVQLEQTGALDDPDPAPSEAAKAIRLTF